MNLEHEKFQGVYVQYGCGWSAPQGWRNFDASPTLRFERLPMVGRWYTKNEIRFPANVEFGDIVKGLPLASESCDGVYCSHVLEHLSHEDFKTALRNTYKLLKPAGLFRLVLPDLEYSVNLYMKNRSPDAAQSFMRETCLGQEKRAGNLKELLVSGLGHGQHLWMWDYKSIQPELESAGFVGIRKASFGDSRDPAFRSVEEKDRWENCLGVECEKPS